MTAPDGLCDSWQLLADRSLVERFSGAASLRLHHPVPRELIPIADGGETYRYMTVFEENGLFRMYYGLIRIAGKRINGPERICYAESTDGKTWTKPALDLIADPGNRHRNIVWMEDGDTRLGVGGFSPFRDDNPLCPPDQRYKAIAEAGPLAKKAFGCNGLVALASPDGLRWRLLEKRLIVSGGPGFSGYDSQNVAFWDSPRNEYRLYHRAVFREGPLNVFRDVLTATSADFLHWSPRQRLSYPGAIPEQLYTNNIRPYFRAPHLFLGFPARYVERSWGDAIAALPETERRKERIRINGAEPGVHDPTGGGGQRVGTSLTDTLFMISRDGLHFDRWDEAFIRPGLRTHNNWFYADNFQNWGLIQTAGSLEDSPPELSFYLTEGSRRHDSNLCRRYTLRMDGFASASAGRAGGELLTIPLPCSGDELLFNFSASAAGSVRVELQDAQGWPIPGFEAEHCVELLGDDLARPVCWEGSPDLAPFVGQLVKIRVLLNDVDLFSFRFRSRAG